MIVGVFTQLIGEGGIERFSRHTATALAIFANEHGIHCRILSLNDAHGLHSESVDGNSFSYYGFNKNKLAMSTAVLRASLHTDFACIAHPNFAPLVLALKVIRPGMHVWIPAYGKEVRTRRGVLVRRGMRIADTVTAISDDTRNHLAKQDLDLRKIKILTPVVESKFFDRQNAHKGADHLKLAIPDGKILLTVARLSQGDQAKGVDMVIDAFPQVLNAVADAYYLVVGDGNDVPRLKERALDRGVQSRVIFLGKLSDEALLACYAACDVFVMPSQQEGFGMVFLEAMAAGKPVVGGSNGGTGHFVREGVNGFLVGEDDIARLASCLTELLSNPQLCQRIGAAGCELVEEHYTFPHFRRNIADLIGECGVGYPSPVANV